MINNIFFWEKFKVLYIYVADNIALAVVNIDHDADSDRSIIE